VVHILSRWWLSSASRPRREWFGPQAYHCELSTGRFWPRLC